MADDQGRDSVSMILESMGNYFVSLGLDDFGEKDGCLSQVGGLGHLQIFDAKGEVALHVFGKDSVELGEQLGLACLQNLSIEHLGALHLRPLNKPLHLPKKNND